MRSSVLVGELSSEKRADGVFRISASINGVDLWFESSGEELCLSPEGFASALLVPAMSHGRDIIFEDPLCPVWLENARKLMEYFSDWWGWKPVRIESRSAEFDHSRAGVRNKRILCFSGGIDSFHSLLTYPEPIDALVMVHGYDIRLDDTEGARIAFAHVRQVAEATGREAVLIRTNYREHPVSGKKYQYSYGGALAGIGHLFDRSAELIISSGMRYDEVDLDGSQWQTDPLWSSRSMKVIHYGADLSKDEKTRSIAGNSLVQNHLRICQSNLKGKFRLSSQYLNCGRCLKCVHTLLVLDQEVGADRMKTFENVSDFDIHLGDVLKCKQYLYEPYAEIRRRGLDKKTDRALRALVRRSKVLNRMEWAGRRGRKAAFGFFRLLDAAERRICRSA